MEEGGTLEDIAVMEGGEEPQQTELDNSLKSKLKLNNATENDGYPSESAENASNYRIRAHSKHSLKSSSSLKSGDGGKAKANDSASQEATNEAVVAIVYHTDEKTGETYYIFEQKPASYPDVSARGLLQPIGGHIDKGEDSLEALIREFGEETPPESGRILKDALMENGELYDKLTVSAGGETFTTYIYKVRVGSKTEWEKILEGGLIAEAGPLRVLTSWQAFTLPSRYYAFGEGPVIKSAVLSDIVRDSFIPQYKTNQNTTLTDNYSFLRTNSLN